tara:strand:+ start:362 stop:691 length:330 start_codon:yes stop_codon:yes gene_type:complete
MPHDINPELRINQLEQHKKLIENIEEILIGIARRRAKHAELVIVMNSDIDEKLAEQYKVASDTLKIMAKQLTPIGVELNKLQPPPPKFFLLRFVNWLFGRKPERKALTA